MHSAVYAQSCHLLASMQVLAMTHHKMMTLAALGVMLLVVLVLMLQPGFWKIVWKPTEADPGLQNPAEPVVPMPRRRVLAAYAIITAILLGSFLDLVRDSEHWPWSCYPMYSEASEAAPTFTDYRLYGVPKDHPDTELSLFTDERYLQPFDQSRLALVLEKIKDDPSLHRGLQNCLDRYEALRRGGRHPGPELIALRMYKVYWTISPDGSNVEKPDRKELIDQVFARPPAQALSKS